MAHTITKTQSYLHSMQTYHCDIPNAVSADPWQCKGRLHACQTWALLVCGLRLLAGGMWVGVVGVGDWGWTQFDKAALCCGGEP